MAFTLAIIGRPNVGKSTLFNRLIGKKMAIVDNTPGVTRDWREAEANLMGLEFTVFDTAGLEENFDDSMEGRMRQQTELAIEQADMVMLMIDVRAGITPLDKHFADWVRRQKIPSILCANKCEGKGAEEGILEAYELGMGEAIAVSAEHGQGMADLYSVLRPYVEAAQEDEEEEEEDDEKIFNKYYEGAEIGFGDEEIEEEEIVRPIKVAFVGRPNVGKSTLLNALLGQQRVMTGPEPGVTRDAITVNWEYEGREFRLVDTAGLRKKAKVYEKIERMATQDTYRAIRLAQVVVLMLDANEVLDKQDLIIASQVVEEGRALVIALNKWDAVEDREESLQRLSDKLQTSLPQIKDVPTVMISALKETRLDKLMEKILDTYKIWDSRVPTGKLNRWLSGMEAHHPAPLVQGRPNRLRYITQMKSRPPTFAIWVSRPPAVAESYKRYLANGLREDFKIPGVPIRIVLRTSKNPYHNK